jgi:hypothetical protein
MRPLLMWSKVISTTGFGGAGRCTRRRADQRLGSPEPRSPVLYGAGRAGSSRFSLAVKPEE